MDSYVSVRGSKRAFNRVGHTSQGAYNRNRKKRVETSGSISYSSAHQHAFCMVIRGGAYKRQFMVS